jgi:DNA-binding NarL/FixJ family response regulator
MLAMPGYKGEGSGSVLLVSTDGTVSRSLLSTMEAATLHVEWARSLDELRTHAVRDDVRTPELVFLDLELPDTSSDQLVPLVLEYFPSATTIALATQLPSEVAAWLLSHGVPSLTKPVSPIALARLALQLSLGATAPWSPRALAASRPPLGAGREVLVNAYAVNRVLSKQQRIVLRLYLDGRNDKEIAKLCGCSEATVYEHWRRMAKKVGGSNKGDAIADFHRFLDCA